MPTNLFSGENLAHHIAKYESLGFSLIPIKPPVNGDDKSGKQPDLMEWTTYQKRRSTPAEHTVWFPPGTKHNVAVVTGSVSNLLVLDLDNDEANEAALEVMPWLPETLHVRTGKGWHYYLRPQWAPGVPPLIIPTKSFVLGGARHHLKAEGGYVVAPPSTHYSGRKYRFVNEHSEVLGVPPDILAARLQALGAEPATPERLVQGGQADWLADLVRANVAKGGRHDTGVRIAGGLFGRLRFRQDLALALVENWNELRCSPPMTDAEVNRIVETVWSSNENQQQRGAA